MIKHITIALALIGLALGVWAVAKSGVAPPSPPPRRAPSINPFPNGIAATGIIETAAGDLCITAPQAGLVTDVFVQVNDRVAKGDKLFQLDRRLLDAQLITARAAAAAAQAQLDRLLAQPRPEDLLPLQAAVRQVEVELADARDMLERTEAAFQGSAATAGELSRRRFAAQGAEAALAEARAQLAQVAAGAWSHDVKIAEANVAQAGAHIEALSIQTERLTVRAPSAGVVLKRWVEPGEFTGSPSGALPGALPGAGAGALPGAMIIGDLAHLRIRAQIDELDMPRIRLGALASARLRGSGAEEIKLKMLRIEPLAQPKRQLAGTNVEFIDTRVVEVLFDVVLPPDVAIYPGQLVDVFVEAEGT